MAVCSQWKARLIVFVNASIDGDMELFAFPLDLVELDSLCAAHIKEQLVGCLFKNGFTVELLWEVFIGFCSDRASVMLGVKSGVGKFLQDDFPGIVLWQAYIHYIASHQKTCRSSVDVLTTYT